MVRFLLKAFGAGLGPPRRALIRQGDLQSASKGGERGAESPRLCRPIPAAESARSTGGKGQPSKGK